MMKYIQLYLESDFPYLAANFHTVTILAGDPKKFLYNPELNQVNQNDVFKNV